MGKKNRGKRLRGNKNPNDCQFPVNGVMALMKNNELDYGPNWLGTKGKL